MAGRGAISKMSAFGEDAALEQCRRDAALVFSMTASVVMFTAMAVSRELPEYAVVATEVKAVLDAFQENPLTGHRVKIR